MGRLLVSCTTWVAVCSAGCGSRTDPGSGTGTLLARIEVQGDVEGTRIEVDLTARSNPVVGAEITFTDVDTGERLVADARGAGRYRTAVGGYRRTLAVEIVAGDDGLTAQLEGPAPHRITRPSDGVFVRRAGFDALRVEWEADDGADRVVVDLEGAERVEIDGDPFEVEVPLDGVDNGEHRLTIERETAVDLRGGTDGSRMRSRYEVDNRFHLEG